MRFNIPRETLLKPLQIVCGVVERRQTLPILSNVLMSVNNNVLRLLATDLEVELIAKTDIKDAEDGEVTVSARKLVDICRALPDGSQIEVNESKGKIQIKAGKSRFVLSTLPVDEFPKVAGLKSLVTFDMPAAAIKNLIDKTYFAMAQQDVRYYLNGVLLELGADKIRAVATDGHRLSVCDATVKTGASKTTQSIVPRKGILELQRLMAEPEENATVTLSENHLRVDLGGITYTAKLVDGKFPDYERVIPQNTSKRLVGDRSVLKDALHRTSILSNEKYRGIRLKISNGGLVASASNPELEEAEEFVVVDYNGDELEIGFNVNYIIDALAAISSNEVELLFTDSNGSCLIQPRDNKENRHVVMPMRL